MTDEADAPPAKTGRTSYLGPPAAFRLDQACAFVGRAFGDTCYLVGSATERVTYRDVDVRIIMGDAKFDALFGPQDRAESTEFWQLICTSVSLYLREQSGLPVDFQIQSMSLANSGRFPGKRHPLGLYVTGERSPKWRGIGWIKRAPWSTWEAKRASEPDAD